MQKELLYQNKKIRYWIEGNGKPVMLVHGFAEDHNVWKEQVDVLAKKYQLILPDLPGSGESELLDETTMESMAEVLKAILDKESISILAMIGHSMGGYVTLAFAEKYGDRLNSFTLFHSTAYPDSEEKRQIRSKAIDFMRKNGVEEFLKTSTPNLFAPETTDDRRQTTRKGMIQQLIDDYKDMKLEALVSYYQAMIKRTDRTAALKGFKKPILFIMGKHDTAVPYDQGVEQSRLITNGEVHTLNNSGHMGMWEEIEKSNQVLEKFLSNLYGIS